jgi:hypothetical protein
VNPNVIPLHELQADAEGFLRRCHEYGSTVVVELPDGRRVRIEPVREGEELIDDLIENDPAFQELLRRSAASLRKPFPPLPAAEEP